MEQVLRLNQDAGAWEPARYLVPLLFTRPDEKAFTPSPVPSPQSGFLRAVHQNNTIPETKTIKQLSHTNSYNLSNLKGHINKYT